MTEINWKKKRFWRTIFNERDNPPRLRLTGKMTSPVNVQDDSALSPTSKRAIPERMVRAGRGLTKLARSPSNGSLNSMLSLMNDPAGSDQHFRVCTHCMNLLEAREKQKAKQFDKPIICQFYEKMREYMSEASQHFTMYSKMCESLKYVEFALHEITYLVTRIERHRRAMLV